MAERADGGGGSGETRRRRAREHPPPKAPRGPRKPPGLVRPLLPEPVAAARALLRALQIEQPSDIELELIAAHLDVYWKERSLAHEEGHMLSADRFALVTIDREVMLRGAWASVLAHEVGHRCMHPSLDDFARCAPRDGKRARFGKRRIENEANDFGTELTMPEAMFAKAAGDEEPTLELVRTLADIFPTGLEATALRLLMHTNLPRAAVCSFAGRVRWWARTPSFETIVPWGGRVGESTSAARVHRGGSDRAAATIRAGVWARSDSTRPVRESAIRLGETDYVLSWLEEEAG